MSPQSILEREFQATLDAVREMDHGPKKDVANYLYSRMSLVAARQNTEGDGAKLDALMGVGVAALEDRNEALRHGAKSRDDPPWAAAALAESWAVAQVGAIQGNFSPDFAESVDAAVRKLIDGLLTGTEKRELEAAW